MGPPAPTLAASWSVEAEMTVSFFSPFLHALPAPMKRIVPLSGFDFLTQTLVAPTALVLAAPAAGTRKIARARPAVRAAATAAPPRRPIITESS
jgi:hypothetical protein